MHSQAGRIHIVAAFGTILALGGCRAQTSAVASGAPESARVRLWVPAYFYPFGDGLKEWERLIAAARDVPVVAIVNPNSGPGDHADTNYEAIIPRARSAGVIVVGYVGTQ